MPLTPAERNSLIERYAAGPARLRGAIAAVPAPALTWRPAPAEWSAHEVAVHCSDSETQAAGRIRFLVAEPSRSFRAMTRRAGPSPSTITPTRWTSRWPRWTRCGPTRRR